MLFNTLAYAKFFALVFFVSWLLARARKMRLVFLLAASYAFYAQWNWHFLPLIFGSSTIDWWLGNAIARAPSQARRRLWLTGTVMVNLGVLAVFKYFNFGIHSAQVLLQALGFHPSEMALHIALPIGISFFTLQSIAASITFFAPMMFVRTASNGLYSQAGTCLSAAACTTRSTPVIARRSRSTSRTSPMKYRTGDPGVWSL